MRLHELRAAMDALTRYYDQVMVMTRYIIIVRTHLLWPYTGDWVSYVCHIFLSPRIPFAAYLSTSRPVVSPHPPITLYIHIRRASFMYSSYGFFHYLSTCSPGLVCIFGHTFSLDYRTRSFPGYKKERLSSSHGMLKGDYMFMFSRYGLAERVFFICIQQ
ncbi:hypothetical protein BS17DRAFT_212122 [Gyrodon lividus]|nr:hypothetical protein BS17DRAFT_212122 [Gyrodon lividus]